MLLMTRLVFQIAFLHCLGLELNKKLKSLPSSLPFNCGVKLVVFSTFSLDLALKLGSVAT